MNIYMQMFIAARFTIDKEWTEAKCPSMDKHVECPYGGIVFNCKKEQSTDARYNMVHLENIILSEGNQTQKVTYILNDSTYMRQTSRTVNS